MGLRRIWPLSLQCGMVARWFMKQRYDDRTEDFAVIARLRHDGVSSWAAVVAFIVSLAVVFVFLRPTASIPPRGHGERKKRSTGREFLAETDVQKGPISSAVAPGWDSERVWSGHDDWEPFLAADRSSTYVYQIVTRFNAQVAGILSAAQPTAMLAGWRIN